VLALASKVKYVIDPDNPYPNNYTAHIRATLQDGSVIEERQAASVWRRAQEPLTRQDVIDSHPQRRPFWRLTKAQTGRRLENCCGAFTMTVSISRRCVGARYDRQQMNLPASRHRHGCGTQHRPRHCADAGAIPVPRSWSIRAAPR